MTRLSLTGKRILAGVAVMQMLFFAANYYSFHFFEPFDRQVLTVSGVLLVIYVLFFRPTAEDFRDYRDKKLSSGR